MDPRENYGAIHRIDLVDIKQFSRSRRSHSLDFIAKHKVQSRNLAHGMYKIPEPNENI